MRICIIFNRKYPEAWTTKLYIGYLKYPQYPNRYWFFFKKYPEYPIKPKHALQIYRHVAYSENVSLLDKCRENDVSELPLFPLIRLLRTSKLPMLR
jgi:hypothetical protein